MELFAPLKIKEVQLSFDYNKFSASSIYPFMLKYKRFEKLNERSKVKVRNHENFHLIEQQEEYWKVAGPLGLLVWYVLYLCCLPVWRNPWRMKWELAAYMIANGWTERFARKHIQKLYFIK